MPVQGEGDGEGESRSVYLLVNFNGATRSSLYEVKVRRGGQVVGETDELLDPVVRFFDKETSSVLPKVFVLQGARFVNRSKLHLLLHQGLQRWWDSTYSLTSPTATFHSHAGYFFDTENGSLTPFEAPLASKAIGVVISAYGNLYYLADTVCYDYMPDPSFECYDPKSNTWKKLPSFPYSQKLGAMNIIGYAVCYGCILLSIIGSPGAEFMVFHLASKRWHRLVNTAADDGQYSSLFSFRGRAVIVEDTIYALSYQFGSVVAFSLRMDSKDDGHVIYSLEKHFLFPPLESQLESGILDHMQTEYLVHLGNLEFCLLQTIYGILSSGRQHVWITTFQIVHGEGGMHIKTLHSTCRVVSIKGCGQFTINFSFTPDYEDFEPGGEETCQLLNKKGTSKKKRKHNKKKKVNRETKNLEPESEETSQLAKFHESKKEEAFQLAKDFEPQGEILHIKPSDRITCDVVLKRGDLEPNDTESCHSAK